ncbi:DNA-3-methyladenine glycosylase 2 family protein [Rhodobacterales bacterium HKCCE2091]|nr:DNA-3-methyladenine glycosylase 2 family protein [Rhodobacterales bacterium HKCCE2091]
MGGCLPPDADAFRHRLPPRNISGTKTEVAVRIVSAEDLAEGAAALVALEPRFAVAIGAEPLPLRLRPDGFGTLLQAIVSQQVSVASAAAIWARMETLGLTSEDGMAAASDDDLRAAGLSRPKQRYARALAAARVDYAGLRGMAPEAVVARLVELPGIGVWTAEIYAKFALGHADVFAAGDLALQEGARRLFGLDARPSEREMRAMAAAWSPWRAVAARALWAYYARDTGREGVT